MILMTLMADFDACNSIIQSCNSLTLPRARASAAGSLNHKAACTNELSHVQFNVVGIYTLCVYI